MTKNKKALLIWASVVPFTAACIALALHATESPDDGYAWPFLAMGALLLIVLAAVMFGLWTSTLKHSLLGVLLGLPTTYAMTIAIAGVGRIGQNIAEDAQREDFRELLPALHRGDRKALVTALTNLRSTSVPFAVCVLAESSQGPNATLISADPQRERFAEYPFSNDALLLLLDAVSDLDIPIAEKEAAFYSVLRTLPFRNDIRAFPKWAQLWDRAHGAAASRFIEIKQAYEVEDPFCPWGNTENLAASVVNYYENELGIRTWLNTGHSFAPAQQRLVLERVESAELLRELAAAGVDINAPHPRAAEGGYFRDSLLATRASSLYQSINEAKSPESVVRLIETMLALGADKDTPSVTGQSPCALFSGTETYLDSSAASPHVTLAERQQAFHAIKVLLCE